MAMSVGAQLGNMGEDWWAPSVAVPDERYDSAPLYRAEFSGAKSEKLKPRIAETALALYKLYVAFTLAEFVALRLAGMTWFEALCHAL